MATSLGGGPRPAGSAGSEISRASLAAAFAAAVGMFVGTTPMIASTQSLFMGPLEAEFGLSRTLVSIILLSAPITVALTGPFGGRLIDRFGVRAIALPVVFAFALVNALMSVTVAVWQVMACFILLGACGSVHSYPAYTKVVATWFKRNRGLVTALMIACGSSFGSILMPHVVADLIEAGGWRSAYLAMAAIVGLFGLPILFLFLKENKAGKAPVSAEGAAPEADIAASAAGAVEHERDAVASDSAYEGVTRSQALRTRTFWTIFFGLSLSVITLFGTLFHVAPMLGERGLGGSAVATTISMFFAGGMMAQLSVGFLLDRVQTPKVALGFFCFAALGLFMLHSATVVFFVYAGALFMGFAQGSENTIVSYFITRYFGLREYNSIYGVTWGMTSMSVVIGSLGMGAAYDLTGSYDLARFVLPAMMALVVVLFATLPPYRYAAGRERAGK